MTSSNGTTLQMADSGGTDTNMNTVMTVGTWYRFGLTHSSGSCSLYRSALDAALTVNTTSGWVQPSGTIGGIYLGWEATAGYSWNGCIANLKAWDVALSAAEVENELSAYQPCRIANLQNWIPYLNVGALADSTVDWISTVDRDATGFGETYEDGPPLRWR